jgi:hypothetical protein
MLFTQIGEVCNLILKLPTDSSVCVHSHSNGVVAISPNDVRYCLLKDAIVELQTAPADHWSKTLSAALEKKDAALQYVAFDQFLEPGNLPTGVRLYTPTCIYVYIYVYMYIYIYIYIFQFQCVMSS